MKFPLTKILMLGAATLSIGHVHATEYAAGLTLDADASYNDNIRLQPNNKISVKHLDLSPQLTLSAETETDKAQLDSTFNFNRYDKSEFNSDDQDVALSLSRQLETGSIGLRAAYVNNSTITSEELTSGRIGNKADRATQYRLSPNGSYLLSENDFIQLSADYTKQDYEDDAYIGYEDMGAQLDWVHLLSERAKLSIGAMYSDYRSDDREIIVPVFVPPFFILLQEQSYEARTKSKGINLGIDYQWSEQSLIKARIGQARNRTTYSINDPNQLCSNLATAGLGACALETSSGTQSTAGLDWNWRNERQNLNLNATKAIQPTSNGYAVDAIQIGSSWSYNVSELDVVTASLSLVRNRAVDEKNTVQNTSIADRNYGSASLQYRRQLNEHWSVDAGFRYAQQKYTDSDYRASAREYTLGIRYQPQQWYWSR